MAQSENQDDIFYDRDLSWLSFNYRVLMEASDNRLPLYERIKFLAIYSSNLDEFYRVRVAAIQSLLELKKKKRKKLGMSPKQVMNRIQSAVYAQLEEFGHIYRDMILPELHANGINLLSGDPSVKEQLEYARVFFRERLLPFMHPEILLPGKITHFLREDALYFVIRLREKTSKKKSADNPNVGTDSIHALLLIPTHYFPRFIELPQRNENYTLIFLDDVIRLNLHQIFPGFEVEHCYSIKLSRNADLQILDEYQGNIVAKIKKNLALRLVGAPARFLYDKAMPSDMLQYLKSAFRLKKTEIATGGKYHNFKDFFRLPNPLSPKLEREQFVSLHHSGLDAYDNIFEAIAKADQLLHFPYHSYDYVIRFFNEAASDPSVTEIQTTQYRVASDSAIVGSLVRAAQSGKKVSVFVEIKARFDEGVNLRFAEEMEKAGIRVEHSLPGLKVHAKVALVTRHGAGSEKKYAFLSTGNFNEKTANIYADHGLLTGDEKIVRELTQLFHFLFEGVQPNKFKSLLVAKFNLKSQLMEKISQEMDNARAGKRSELIFKVNNLEDREIIQKLADASRAGVQIDLIVRGICCLRPGIPGKTENIRITRIVDRFLEHARVFIFHNNGRKRVLMGSSDLMDRNLNHRIEVVFPLKNRELAREIMHILELQLKDNVKAVLLNRDLQNITVRNDQVPVQAQEATYEYIRQLHAWG